MRQFQHCVRQAALLLACTLAVLGTSPAQTALTATARVDAGRVVRAVPPTLFGTNVEWVWNAYGLWVAPQQLNPDLVSLTGQIRPSLIRFPGGWHADFYRWRDGVGPLDQRPLMAHQLPTGDKSKPNFGTDEALDFASRVGGELLITVNAGTGTAEEAAAWVRYVNASGLRVRYWEVGNELYINDGSPVSKALTIPPDVYARRFVEFARAMKAADPRIKVGAIGGLNEGPYRLIGYTNWNATLLQIAGADIDFLAVHNSYAPVLNHSNYDLPTVYRAMMAAPVSIARNLARLDNQIRNLVPARQAQIPVAVTEWGPFFQMDPLGRYVDHNKTLGSAVFAASVFKAFLESPRTAIANTHTLHDLGVMGWIGSTSNTFPAEPQWTGTPRYLLMRLLRDFVGATVVGSSVTGPTFDSTAVGWVAATQRVPAVETIASLSADGQQLNVILINKHLSAPVDVTVDLGTFRPQAQGSAWVLSGTGPDAHLGTQPLQLPGQTWGVQATDTTNPRFPYGGPGEVTYRSESLSNVTSRLRRTVAPCSVTALSFRRAS